MYIYLLHCTSTYFSHVLGLHRQPERITVVFVQETAFSRRAKLPTAERSTTPTGGAGTKGYTLLVPNLEATMINMIF